MALANATQERLELENKLMVLEAKKEQMDTLLRELQSLKEAQLRKGTFVFSISLEVSLLLANVYYFSSLQQSRYRSNKPAQLGTF